jgi:hypothetical protein
MVQACFNFDFGMCTNQAKKADLLEEFDGPAGIKAGRPFTSLVLADRCQAECESLDKIRAEEIFICFCARAQLNLIPNERRRL